MIPAFSSLSRSFSIAGLNTYGTYLDLRKFGVAFGFICKVVYKPFSEPVCVLKMLWFFAMISSKPTVCQCGKFHTN